MEMWNLILPNFALTMWIIRILWFRIKFDYKLPAFDRSNRFMEWPKRLENDKKLLIHEKRIKFDIFLKCNKSITKYWKLRKFSYQYKYFSPKKNFMHARDVSFRPSQCQTLIFDYSAPWTCPNLLRICNNSHEPVVKKILLNYQLGRNFITIAPWMLCK